MGTSNKVWALAAPVAVTRTCTEMAGAAGRTTGKSRWAGLENVCVRRPRHFWDANKMRVYLSVFDYVLRDPRV